MPGSVGYWSEPGIVNMGTFEDQACRDRFIAGLVSEPLQGKLNSNGHRNKEGNIVQFRTVVQIAKNYESSTDAVMRGDL